MEVDDVLVCPDIPFCFLSWGGFWQLCTASEHWGRLPAALGPEGILGSTSQRAALLRVPSRLLLSLWEVALVALLGQVGMAGGTLGGPALWGLPGEPGLQGCAWGCGLLVRLLLARHVVCGCQKQAAESVQSLCVTVREVTFR